MSNITNKINTYISEAQAEKSIDPKKVPSDVVDLLKKAGFGRIDKAAKNDTLKYYQVWTSGLLMDKKKLSALIASPLFDGMNAVQKSAQPAVRIVFKFPKK